MFWWRQRLEPEGYRFGVEWCITDREGGVSQEEYQHLNLGSHVGDIPEAVDTNRHRLAHQLGIPAASLRFMNQVHGADVAHADGHRQTQAPRADAMLTTSVDIALVVLVADCVPVLLVDRSAGSAAVVHAGRLGMMAQVAHRAVRKMRAAGCHDIEAIVGPSVCSRCYEVPEELRAEAAAVHPAAYSVSWSGTAAIDIAAAVVAQLIEDEVTVRWLPGCTREEQRLYSYRRDGTTGRFAGVVRLLAPEGVA